MTAINDLADSRTMTHLLKYDSIHGVFQKEVEATEDGIKVAGTEVRLFNFVHPRDIPWSECKVHIVIEASGKFKTRASLKFHLANGAKKSHFDRSS